MASSSSITTDAEASPDVLSFPQASLSGDDIFTNGGAMTVQMERNLHSTSDMLETTQKSFLLNTQSVFPDADTELRSSDASTNSVDPRVSFAASTSLVEDSSSWIRAQCASYQLQQRVPRWWDSAPGNHSDRPGARQNNGHIKHEGQFMEAPPTSDMASVPLITPPEENECWHGPQSLPFTEIPYGSFQAASYVSAPQYQYCTEPIVHHQEAVTERTLKPTTASAHNQVEKRYRANLNRSFFRLRDSVPSIRRQLGDQRDHILKGKVYEAAIAYIKSLEHKIEVLEKERVDTGNEPTSEKYLESVQDES